MTSENDESTAHDRSVPEIGAWFKSSASASNGNCVEVSRLADGGVGVRDSKDPEGGALRFTQAEWAAFLDGAKGLEFDGLLTA